MKKIIVSVLCLFLLISLLASCSAKPVKLKYEGGAYINKGAGYELLCAPLSNYRVDQIYNETAVAVIETAYEKTPLYEIPGMDKKLWLADSEGSLYYDRNTHLPTLGEMEVSEVSVCIQGDRPQVLVTLTDQSKIATLCQFVLQGESKERKYFDGEKKNGFELVFSSSANPGLLYTLEYWRLTTNDGVIFDRSTGLCYPVGTVVEEYFGGQ